MKRALAALLFMGGIIIGIARWARLPGPYILSGDTRAIQTESIVAAEWVRDVLGSANNVTADRTNELLLGSYGEQNVIHGVSWIYFYPALGSSEQVSLQRADVHFIVADRRLTTMLPLSGYYFERGEPGSRQHTEPMSAALQV